jgi:hypothetical protein
MFQQALLPIFLLVINVFSGVRAQTFTIVSDRIEYIDPETHKLITITKTLEILNRLNFHESIIILPFISQKMMTALAKH